MANLPYHPAPGVVNGGKLPPGFLVNPQGEAERNAYGVYRTRGIAELIPAMYGEPENPVKRAVGLRSGVNGISGVGDCGCGCGGGGGCGGSRGSLNGIGVGDLTADWTKISGDLSSGNFTTAIQDTVYGFPVWGILAGLAFLFMMDTGGGSQYVRTRRATRAAVRAY
jgi:hypothetical protein